MTGLIGEKHKDLREAFLQVLKEKADELISETAEENEEAIQAVLESYLHGPTRLAREMKVSGIEQRGREIPAGFFLSKVQPSSGRK